VEGTPQGGPLSPLLSNLVLDRTRPRAGAHRFVRYADDCNIYVRSETCGSAGDGEHLALHHTKAQAQGKRGEECGGTTAGTEVPRVQLHGWSGHQALRKPITGIASCCARAASGYAIAAPPRSVMKSRRLMQPPRVRTWLGQKGNYHICALVDYVQKQRAAFAFASAVGLLMEWSI